MDVIHIVWEFVVRPEAVGRFVEAYGPHGDWARLFARHAGFRGTSLLQDADNPRRFLTIDRWETEDHFRRMKADSGAEYARLDSLFAELTEFDRELGVFRSD